MSKVLQYTTKNNNKLISKDTKTNYKQQKTTKMAKLIQIDVKEITGQTVECNLYTGNRCVTILMHVSEYNQLINDGFFIRDGKNKDSAGIINTTNVFSEDIIICKQLS